MGELTALMLGALIVAGVATTVLGVRGDTPPIAVAFRKRYSMVFGRLRRELTRPKALVRYGVALGAGMMALAITGWPIMAVCVPVAVLFVPLLLGAPKNKDMELLAALDRWVRLLAATLATGVSIHDGIRATQKQVPAVLQSNISTLLDRLNDRLPAREALSAMADELGNPDADAVLASLTLAFERGGTGTVATLNALADSIQDRLRAGREIEAERAKPRIVVRQVTIVTLTVLGAALIFGGDFFAPYGTWYGQIILAVLIGLYLLSLVWLRQMSVPRARERILQ